jgi:hypothetical protein
MTDDRLNNGPPDARRNSTDYDFPQGWGLMSAEQKSEWFLQERVCRQASRQECTTENFSHE